VICHESRPQLFIHARVCRLDVDLVANGQAMAIPSLFLVCLASPSLTDTGSKEFLANDYRVPVWIRLCESSVWSIVQGFYVGEWSQSHWCCRSLGFCLLRCGSAPGHVQASEAILINDIDFQAGSYLRAFVLVHTTVVVQGSDVVP
jgi:hypothetical protein